MNKTIKKSFLPVQNKWLIEESNFIGPIPNQPNPLYDFHKLYRVHNHEYKQKIQMTVVDRRLELLT